MEIRKHHFSVSSSRSPEFLPGRPFMQAWLMSYCALVGAAERYIISVSVPWKRKIENSVLENDLRLCFGQEAQHALTHDEFGRQLILWGLNLKVFLNASYIINYKFLPAFMSKRLQLASAAAMEQMNTCIGIQGLKYNWLAHATDPDIRNMLEWHFREEIEHRSVIFDLMNEVKVSHLGQRSMALLVFAGFSFWIAAGAILVSLSTKRLWHLSWWKDAFEFLFAKEAIVSAMFLSALKFFDTNYHPKCEWDERSYCEVSY